MESYNIAILGATGLVGAGFLEILEQREFPVKNIRMLTSDRSSGKTVKFRGKSHECMLAEPGVFRDVDLVLASAGSSVSRILAMDAVQAGAVFIDNSSAFRMDEDVPLVMSGVNSDDIKMHKGIIANPNCSTSQLVPVLDVISKLSPMKRVIVSTYQSVSGAGRKAINELEAAKGPGSVFPRGISGNVIPHIDSFEKSGFTAEELKVVNETRKILHLPDLPLSCTAVRVPVKVGHSETVTVELQNSVERDALVEALSCNPHIRVMKNQEDYPTPAETAGTDPVYVGRIRRDPVFENAYTLWIVADNLRIGAALNTVRIAEDLVGKYRDTMKKRG